MATLEVITGPMFSGKSEELIRRLKRETYAEKKILIIKPSTDTRSDGIEARQKFGDKFSSSFKMEAIAIGSREEIENIFKQESPQVLAVDEAQFFDSWFADFISDILLEKNLRIICVGLDLDAWGNPFGIMPILMAMADNVKKETSICFNCRKNLGTMTYKKIAGIGQVEVGDAELYESRCRDCWKKPE